MLAQLRRIALRSDRKQRHSAIVLKGGAVQATASNWHNCHAEVRALKKLWPSKRQGTTVISFRIKPDGEEGLAYPCKACTRFMVKAGVKECYFSNEFGILERMYLGSHV